MAWNLMSATATNTFDFLDADPEDSGSGPAGFGRPWPADRKRPTRARLERRRRPRKDGTITADLEVAYNPRHLIASPRFRALLERHEPGVHEFFPLTIEDHDGTVLSEDWHLFNCTQWFASCIADRSGLHGAPINWARSIHGRPYAIATRSSAVLSRPQIAGRKLWMDRFFGLGFLMADDLATELRRTLHVGQWSFEPIAEADEPWDMEENLGPWLDWARANGEPIYHDTRDEAAARQAAAQAKAGRAGP